MIWMKNLVLMIISAALLAGCNEYEVKTTVREDGGGTRKTVFRMDPDQDEITEHTPETYARMFGIGPDGNWEMQTIADTAEYSDRPGKRVFTLESSIDGIEDWSKLDGSIGVSGTLEDSDYSGIFFRNSVSLETGTIPSGRSWTYRESFRWNGLVEAVVDFQADAYARRMKRDFPHLSGEQVAELKGMMAGHLLVAVRFLNIWDDKDEELEKVALSAGKAAEDIVNRAGRKVAVEHVYELARTYVADEDEALEPFLEKNMPGVIYASLTEVRMNLVMPGNIVDTNGRVLDDGSVEWKMNLMEALGGAVEFHARSEQRR
jgi:hypothetical protein